MALKWLRAEAGPHTISLDVRAIEMDLKFVFCQVIFYQYVKPPSL
jgi:hypothetical protein